MMFHNIRILISRSTIPTYSIGFFLLVIMIGLGLYLIDARYKSLEETIDNQLSVNSIMNNLTGISEQRGKIMLLLLNEDDPFNRDDLIQEYNGQTRKFLINRDELYKLKLSKIQTDIFSKTMEAISSAYTHQVKTVNLVNEDSMTEAKQLFLEKILPYKLIIRSHYNNLIISMRQQAKVEINNAQKASRVTMVVTVALLAIVFILSMWIQFLAFRATSRYNNLLVEHNDKLEHTVKVRTNELRVAKEEADRANTTKSKFLSAMSHELRTPMNAILGYGQLLEFDIDSFTDLQSENVKSIISAGHHLMTLINELQNLSKIESGKMELNIDALSLNDLFKKSISLIQPQAILRKIKVINNIGLHNYYVRADFTRLLQVFINLLSNAVKYGNDNSQVFLDPEEVNTNRIRIKVTNTGVGLSKKQIDKLFISFERLNESEGIEGTGLGLVITKSLIEIMGGAIGVESTLGNSTTFWVELPLTEIP